MLILEKHKIYKIEEINSFQKIVEIAISRGYINHWKKQDFHLETNDIYAYKKLVLITKVLNDGWKPNYKDSDERKWYCWFSVSSGFAFTTSANAYDYTNTNIGSRLCFKTQEISDFAGRTYVKEFEQFLM